MEKEFVLNKILPSASSEGLCGRFCLVVLVQTGADYNVVVGLSGNCFVGFVHLVLLSCWHYTVMFLSSIRGRCIVLLPYTYCSREKDGVLCVL